MQKIIKKILITAFMCIITHNTSYAMEPGDPNLAVYAINIECISQLPPEIYANIVACYLEQYISTPGQSPDPQESVRQRFAITQVIHNLLNTTRLPQKATLLALSYLSRVKETREIMAHETLLLFMVACHHAHRIINQDYTREKWLDFIAHYNIALKEFRQKLITMYTALNFNLNTNAEVLERIMATIRHLV